MHPIQQSCNEMRQIVRQQTDQIIPYAKAALTEAEFKTLEQSLRQLKSLNPFEQFEGAATAEPLVNKVKRYIDELRKQTGE